MCQISAPKSIFVIHFESPPCISHQKLKEFPLLIWGIFGVNIFSPQNIYSKPKICLDNFFLSKDLQIFWAKFFLGPNILFYTTNSLFKISLFAIFLGAKKILTSFFTLFFFFWPKYFGLILFVNFFRQKMFDNFSSLEHNVL